MNELVMTGRIESALAHLAPIGLVNILRDGADPGATFHWDVERVRPVVTTALSHESVGEALKAFAGERCTDSWVAASIAQGPRAGLSLFSPRNKAAKGEREWLEYEAEREAWLDGHAMSRLDQALLGGFGEPAWWSWTPQGSQPDQGASRWEMKTRNKGQEVMQDRLLPLTQVIADRTTQSVIDGLVGDAVVDEKGSKVDSRTATGFRPPGPVDSAVAYVALHALASLPVVRRLGTVADSVGLLPRERVHPAVAVLPIFGVPTSSQRFRSIMASAGFDETALSLQPPERAEESIVRGWLAEQGVLALLRSQVRKTGSSSAPERQILDGEVILL